jgi:UDP-N-acetylglucosamine 1-carboxyvinyltransferase
LASFIIKGGIPLSGELRIHGAKNAALPILAASIMASGEQNILDVPELLDIKVMIDILRSLGVKASHTDQTVSLDTSLLSTTSIPEDMMGKMRSSIFLMGPLLAKYGEVRVSRPGGCAIGERPIDLHLSGLASLGATITEEHGEIYCQAQQLRGAHIHLRMPSVGATENLLMAATLAQGTTKITNAAREPEIVDLQGYLVQMGAKIKGAGTDCIEVEGVDYLRPVTYQVIPDRIITGTILLAAAITRGEVALTNVRPEHLESLLYVLETSGVDIRTYRDIIMLKANNNILRSVDPIQTSPHPGFPTDMQAQMMAYLATVEGTSAVKESIFEGRLKHVDELNRMGSNITVDLNMAFIRGVPRLSGSTVEATDLRAGAALVIAGLHAQGTTQVTNVHHIDRGYQHLEKMLQALGADIDRI